MPPKKNQQKDTYWRGTRKGKRKNISPLCTDIGGHNESTISTSNQTEHLCTVDKPVFTNTGCYTAKTQDDSSNKRIHLDNYNFDFTTMAMNYPQQTFGGQFMQSPPFMQPFTPGTPTTPFMSNQPPPWAASIIEDLKTIKISLANIGSLEQTEQTVNLIKVKMEDLEIKVTDVDKRVTEVERSSAFIGAKYES